MSVGPGSSAAAGFEARALRAELLAVRGERTSPSAPPGQRRDPLHFAAVLCRAQRDIARALERRHSDEPFTGSLADDLDHLLPLAASLLRTIGESGPDLLASQALARLEDEEPVAGGRLLAHWNGDTSAREDYLSRAILRPYAEFLRVARVAPDRLHAEGHCPFCGGTAAIGSLSAGGGEEGAIRRLHCGLCGNGWIFSRMRCPACAEQAPDKLPVYRTEAHPAARIEACDTCRRYLKSIDLTRDAAAIPEIDDLASIALDLWASEADYMRLEPGLAGV